MTELTRIEAVFIEDNPFPTGEPDVFNNQYMALPRWVYDALGELFAHPDITVCWSCGDTTGYVLRYNNGGFESLAWRPTGLARVNDGRVAVLCEDCSPYIPEAPPETT